ncbi:DUF637 domain-containing protein [Agaribacterium sp. ZY112]|uniref:DUF637 domain-containing protein n=1 Tax=Agaribacterium sp. ZY112 TaxID=3233574 RepID=UPI0035256F91
MNIVAKEQGSVSKKIIKRITAYALSALVLMNPLTPALAQVLNTPVIQSDFASNPIYLDAKNSSYEYETPHYLEWSSSGLKSSEWLYQETLKANSDLISPTTYVPIAVGDITTFITTHRQYDYVGTVSAQARYVRTQIQALLGRSIKREFSNEAAQLDELYSNAYDYLNNEARPPHVKYGVPLSLDQTDSGLGKDMVWPELRTINGRSVIVPIVYLTKETVKDQKITRNTNEISGWANFEAFDATNVDIRTARNTFINATQGIQFTNSRLTGEGNLKIVAGGTFDNASSIISANGNLDISGKSIHNHTIVYRYDLGYEQGTSYGTIASINSTDGSITLESTVEDIKILGAKVSANEGSVTLSSAGDIVVAGLPIFSSSSSRYGSAQESRSATSYLQSYITAEDTIELMAAGKILIDASEIISDSGHISLLAGMGITVQDQLSSTQSYYQRGSETEEAYKSVAIRSFLDAGKGITIRSEFGDITLRAADITSVDGTSVSAAGGALKLLLAKENDHYSYSNVKENLFTTSTINRGHTRETAVYNSIVGGFSVEAAQSIHIQYGGKEGLSLKDQVDAFQEIEGMEWVADLYYDETTGIDWEEVDVVYKSWDKHDTSLNAAAMAVIAIVAAVATMGAGAALVGAAHGMTAAAAATAHATTVAVTQAAVASMATLAAQASANAAVNGENPLEVFEAAYESILSEQGARTIATSMVTAWAMNQVSAEFFTEVDVNKVDDSWLFSAPRELSLTGQATQAFANSVVSAGVQTAINEGDFSDFGDALGQSIAMTAVNTIGQKMATAIGDAAENGHINTAIQYVAHAGAGCISGVASASISEGEIDSNMACQSGAGGAVVGELVGQYYSEGLDEDMLEWANEAIGPDGALPLDEVMYQADLLVARGADMAKLSAAVSAFVAGMDVNIAATAGYTAARFNALDDRETLLAEKVSSGYRWQDEEGKWHFGSTYPNGYDVKEDPDLVAKLEAAAAVKSESRARHLDKETACAMSGQFNGQPCAWTEPVGFDLDTPIVFSEGTPGQQGMLGALNFLEDLGEAVESLGAFACDMTGCSTVVEIKRISGGGAVSYETVLLAIPIVGKFAGKFFLKSSNQVTDLNSPVNHYGVTNESKALLKRQLKAQEESVRLANGHAFKHVTDDGYFPFVETREEFAKHIEKVMTYPTHQRLANGGREYFYDLPTETFVVLNPRDPDGGSVFKETLDYFINEP